MIGRAGRTRITGGELRGRWLTVPPGVRPTGSRVREALFSIWSERIRGARFLDLFAGSGAVGLEALGRGAAEVVLVEADRWVAQALRASVARLAPSGCRVVVAALPEAFERLEGARFDLIFADPPYAFDAYEQILGGAAALLEPEGVVAVEHAARVEPPRAVGALARRDCRRYGDSRLSVYML